MVVLVDLYMAVERAFGFDDRLGEREVHILRVKERQTVVEQLCGQLVEVVKLLHGGVGELHLAFYHLLGAVDYILRVVAYALHILNRGVHNAHGFAVAVEDIKTVDLYDKARDLAGEVVNDLLILLNLGDDLLILLKERLHRVHVVFAREVAETLALVLNREYSHRRCGEESGI